MRAAGGLAQCARVERARASGGAVMGNMKRNLPERITLDALRAAYVREAPYHPDWPAAFEGVIANPLTRGVLVALTRSAPAFKRGRADRWRGLSGKDRAAGERED